MKIDGKEVLSTASAPSGDDGTGPHLTTFVLEDGRKFQYHPKREEAMEPVTPGVPYEGPRHPTFVQVFSKEENLIVEQAAEIARLNELLAKKK